PESRPEAGPPASPSRTLCRLARADFGHRGRPALLGPAKKRAAPCPRSPCRGIVGKSSSRIRSSLIIGYAASSLGKLHLHAAAEFAVQPPCGRLVGRPVNSSVGGPFCLSARH